ncbi:MAG TPA: RagB/SusD family nutrient uptake outer membrane protein, partial [Candidatus Limnocylindrales bacterium]|nr:RagB/SusD family nutrient uptake outer membrane protein [Candidatus Limnocylindrales bacterium]
MFSSCMGDLDTRPLDGRELTAADVFDDPTSYQRFLAKLYAGLSLTGQEGPSGMPDISGIDEGFSQYLRAMFHHQVLSTDEAVIGWADQTLLDFVHQDWTSTDVFVAAFYYRIFYQIAMANEFLRETSDANLDRRGVTGQLRTDIQGYRLEARFLRALSYWHALDVFGNVPFITENDPMGGRFLPPQIRRADLFVFLENELKAIYPNMAEPRSPGYYGRADRAAAWMLLAKLYLNAEVYIGQPRYTEVITYTTRIINAGYTLEPNFRHLFNADNHRSHGTEIIFTVPFDGIHTNTWGGTTFMIRGGTGGTMNPLHSGIESGWGGLRTTRNIVNLYSLADGRRLLHTHGQTLDIDDLTRFTDGYASTKFTNIRRDGSRGSSLAWVDTDFPMFRLADVYLMYAEAVLRGGTGGSRATAIGYVNALRQRAWGSAAGNVTDITLDFILDERARELFWEGHRRTDL